MTNSRSILDAFGRQDALQQESLPELTANRIRMMINRGELPPGTQLPNEIELAEAIGVSRGTVRSALSLLQQHGLIWRRQGVGSFVSEIPILQNRLDINLGVTDLIESMGLQPGSKVLKIEIIPADQDLARQLDLSEGRPLVSVRRIRTADEKPVVASVDIFPVSLLEGGPEKMTFQELEKEIEKKHSIYRIFENRLSLMLEYGLAKLRPVKMSAQTLKQLGLDLPPGSVMLYLEQVDYDRNRRPVVISYEYHVPDFCEFTIYRRR